VLRTGVRAAVEMQPQRRHVVAEPHLERVDECPEPRLCLGDREVAVRLAGAGDRATPDRVRVELEPELGEPRNGVLDLRVRDVRKHEVLLTRHPCLAAEAVEQLSDREQLRAGDEAKVNGNADRRQPVLLLRLHPDVVRELPFERGEREVGQRVAQAALDLRAHALGADVVDHELHPRLDARDAVAEVLAPGVEQCAEHGDRLVGTHEDAEIARDARHRREAAADEDAEPRLTVAEDADERDAVDLRREAAIGAGADRDLVLTRQVDVVRMPGEEGVRLLDDRRRVEQLVVRDPRRGAAGDRAHGVTAAAEARQARGVELLEDVGELSEAQVVELDVLARRQLRLATAVVEREVADRLELRGRQPACRQLDAEHERADLRLVVVEAPPFEADDVLLRDVRVAGGDQRGQLVEHPERALLPLEALDPVPLQHELERGGLGGCSAAACLACHPQGLLSVAVWLSVGPGGTRAPVPGGPTDATATGAIASRLPSTRSPLRVAAHGWTSHLTGRGPGCGGVIGPDPSTARDG
jgi:hypothetical protein